MEKIYTFDKQELLSVKIDRLKIVFTNGDVLALKKEELIEESIIFCDDLQRAGEGYCFFAKEAMFKLKISKNPAKYDKGEYLYNKKQYKEDRKGYIEGRCVNKQDICNIQIYDENNWHYDVFSNYMAEIEGEYLVIKGNYKGNADERYGKICLRDIQLKDVCIITIDFENCEYFDVYNDEILDFKLDYSENLCWGGDKLCREIKSGYIRIKIENQDRRTSDWIRKHYTKKQLEERICGKEGFCEHDICHLYMNLPYYMRDETIHVIDIRSEEVLKGIEKIEEETGEEIMPCFIGGYAKKLDDGSICITFGKKARALIDKP